jgi:ribonuclease H2 subunit A
MKKYSTEDSDAGSGYPSDPKTKAWLQNNIDQTFGYPDFVRFSWKTCYHILKPIVPKATW